jgi:predicted nucleic acid-binding protein
LRNWGLIRGVCHSMYLIVDANILLGAVLGQSLPLLAEIAARDSVLLVPARMIAEARGVVADTARIPAPGAFERLLLAESLVTALEPLHYEHLEAQARARLIGQGEKDWPLIASALALDAPVWSNDKHLWGTGVAVWVTRNIRFWNDADLPMAESNG